VADAPTLADVLRRPGYLRLLAVCGILGVPVSAAAFGFLALEHEGRHLLWEALPDAVGFDEVPWWWGIPSLVVAGLLVAFAAARLPGHGGHVPADPVGPAPTEPRALPGVLLAGLASLCLGAVLGPEVVLLAVGSATALLLVPVRVRSADPSASALIGASGAFAAIATVLGSPLIGAVFMMEAVGFGGARLFALLLPGLLASGIGALMFTGLGDWTGLETDTLGLPPLPDLPRPDVADVLWSVPLGILAALIAHVARLGSRQVLPRITARPLLVTPLAGLTAGALAGAYALITGHAPDEALFSGQETIGTLIGQPERWTDGELVLLIACFGSGYAISLASFRGGPIFPAVLIGVALGILLGDLPGLGRTPAIAILMAAFAVSMLRLPVSSIVLVALLLTSSGLAVIPLAIVAAVTAFVVTELIEAPSGR
jgi:hypothetical protein